MENIRIAGVDTMSAPPNNSSPSWFQTFLSGVALLFAGGKFQEWREKKAQIRIDKAVAEKGRVDDAVALRIAELQLFKDNYTSVVTRVSHLEAHLETERAKNEELRAQLLSSQAAVAAVTHLQLEVSQLKAANDMLYAENKDLKSRIVTLEKLEIGPIGAAEPSKLVIVTDTNATHNP